MFSDISNYDTLFFMDAADKDGIFEIVAAAGKAAEPEHNILHEKKNAALQSILKDSNQVLPDYTTFFRISFENPIAYQITDESFTLFDETAVGDRKNMIAIFRKSKYLEYVMNSTLITVLGGDYRHYCICTAEKIIDVISDNIKIEKINFRW